MLGHDAGLWKQPWQHSGGICVCSCQAPGSPRGSPQGHLVQYRSPDLPPPSSRLFLHPSSLRLLQQAASLSGPWSPVQPASSWCPGLLTWNELPRGPAASLLSTQVGVENGIRGQLHPLIAQKFQVLELEPQVASGQPPPHSLIHSPTHSSTAGAPGMEAPWSSTPVTSMDSCPPVSPRDHVCHHGGAGSDPLTVDPWALTTSETWTTWGSTHQCLSHPVA